MRRVPPMGRPSTQVALQGAHVAELAVAPPTARPSDTVASARRSIVGRRLASISHVVLVEEGRFAGMVRDVDLMAADDATQLSQLVIEDAPVVAVGATRDAATWAALSRGESEVVVVGETGELVGIVPASTLLAVLAREHADDMARLSGYLHQGESARAATEEHVMRRFWHRLPWLVVGLIGAVVAAQVVAGFEHALEQDVMIAFFIPGIVYLADAVGTQTEAVVIRGLSLGVTVRRIVARELATGAVLGATLGALFFPAALLLGTGSQLALAVAVSLALACATANLIAIAVPWALQRLGRDPAFGSGPLATVIQDILSILVYFAIVSAVVLS